MSKIRIKEIIESQGLNIKEVAKQLFPKNKYPRLALNRVMSGEAFLDSEQMSKFALIAGVEVQDLYMKSGWKQKSKGKLFTFTNGEFKAELDTENWTTKIFHNESLFHDSVITSGFVSLSEYIDSLNSIITKYTENESSEN